MLYIYEALRWFLMTIYNNKDLIIYTSGLIVFLITSYFRYPWIWNYIFNKIKPCYDGIKNKINDFISKLRNKK